MKKKINIPHYALKVEHIIQINTIGTKFIKFIDIKGKKYQEKTIKLFEFYFKDEEIINPIKLEEIIKNNISNTKSYYLVLTSNKVEINYFKIPNNFFKNSNIFKSQVLEFLDTKNNYIFIRKNIRNKFITYRSISIPNNQYEAIRTIFLNLNIKIKEYILSGDYFNIKIKEKNQDIVILKRELGMCLIYIYDGKLLVSEANIRCNKDESFIINFSIYISNYEKKNTKKISKYYIIDSTKYIQSCFNTLDIPYEEIEYEK